MAARQRKKGTTYRRVTDGKKVTIKSKSKSKNYNGQMVNKTSVPIGLGFPKRMVITHKYTEVLAMGASSGAFTKYQFSCNGMYDPNISGTGHQPMYFDQMAALYNHYTVIGSKINIKFTPSIANQEGMYVGCYLDDDTTTTNVTDISAVSEQTTGKITVIPPSSTDTRHFTRKWSAKKTFGGSVLGNDLLQGNAAGNPSEQTYYTFAIQGFGANSVYATAFIEYTFIAVWDELRNVSQS